MKHSVFAIILSILVSNTIVYSQSQKVQFELNSRSVADEIYPIEVILPDAYDSTKQYPIVYFTDWWFYLQYDLQLHNLLRDYNITEPFIIVGIGTIGERTDWNKERRRDLTPTHLLEQDRRDSLDIGSRGITGGAENFLSFIKNELIPKIEAKFQSDTLNRGFVGYSFGGLFGAYILLNEPQLFQNYIIGSPTLQYDNFIILQRLMEVTPEQFNSIKSIFVSVGEQELGDDLKSFAELRDLLLKMDLPNLKLESTIIEGEGHISALPQTLIKGFRFVYGNN